MKPPSAKTSPTTPGAGPAVTARKQADLWTIAPLDMPLSEYWQALQHEWEVMSVSKLEKKKWERNFETAVAECMKGRGFEYFPTVEESDDSEYSESPSSVMMAHLLPVPDLDPERELVVQRGYGVDTARYDKQALEKNKNAQYVRSLSRKSLDRYVEALRGVKPDDESGDDDLPGSCRAIAYETYPDPEDIIIKILSEMHSRI
jgi:hypothetical protein